MALLSSGQLFLLLLTVSRKTDMSDIEKAKELLKSEGFTCVMCKGKTLYTSEKRGVVPALEKLEQNIELKGFSVADKVIGKAAAMLFHLAGISVLYGEIMSVPAKEYLEKTGIEFSYGMLIDRIINRNGDGLCPMETAVSGISDPDEGLRAIKNKLIELRKA